MTGGQPIDPALVPELPGYRLIEQIGSGGSGVVYRAEGSDELRRPFAIKLFPPAQQSAYERELTTLRAIEAVRSAASSRDLVETVAADVVDDHGYVVMEYVQGGTLEERVRQDGPLPPREAVNLLLPVLRALTLLHRDGILHKDVKPANVLVGDDGQTKLGDFGLARPLDSPVSSAGTPGFCAPELYAGRRLEAGGERLDVYSAAATLYYLLTSEAPLPGRPDLFLLERRRVDRALQGVLFEALSEEPSQRLASAAALEERLTAWSEGRLRTPRPRRTRTLLALCAAALLALALPLAAVLLGGEGERPELWNGRELCLAGPAVVWEGGRADVAGRGSVQALSEHPVASARDAGGRILAAVGPYGEVVALDLNTPRVLLRRPGLEPRGTAPLCAVATDGRFLARLIVGTEVGSPERVEVFDLESGAVVRSDEDTRGACALALLPGGVLLFGRPDGRLVVSSQEGDLTVQVLRDEILALACDAPGGRVLVVGDDRALLEGPADGDTIQVDGSLTLSTVPELRLEVLALEPLLAGRLEVLSEVELEGSLQALDPGRAPLE